MRSILITNNHLVNFGGSELVSVELAEYYASIGWSVVLHAPTIGEPLRSTIDSAVTVTPTLPELSGWDIIWDHHGVAINKLTRDSAKRIVCNHMSSYVDLERPQYESSKPHLILANSQETINSMPASHGMRAKLFQNPAPKSFEGKRVRAEYALLVSNHRPKALEQMMELVGIPMLCIGQHDRFERLDWRHLSRAAFVVCNGKSTQYALRAGCPVFLYDHFGGPGWLTEENFAVASHFNFSGRGFHEPIEPEVIALWPGVMPIRRVNWRFKLEEWLYYMELV